MKASPLFTLRPADVVHKSSDALPAPTKAASALLSLVTTVCCAFSLHWTQHLCLSVPFTVKMLALPHTVTSYDLVLQQLGFLSYL